jgi:hypothetical protein
MAHAAGIKMGDYTDWMARLLSARMAIVLGGKTASCTGLMAQRLSDLMAGAIGLSMATHYLKLNGGGQYGECMTEAMTELALFELLTLECRVDDCGIIRYYNAQGQLHRVYGPAVDRADGAHAWYQNGQLHRLDGPAVVRLNNYRTWYHNGQLHRLDGPAIEWADGNREWFVNGKPLTEAEWQQAVASMGITND